MKGCPKWKGQQRTLWKEVWEETGRGKRRWKAHELFDHKRCSQAVLDFLASMDVGKVVPAVEVEDDAGSESSEWELRKSREREEEREREAVAVALGAGVLGTRRATGRNPRCSFQPPFMASAGEE